MRSKQALVKLLKSVNLERAGEEKLVNRELRFLDSYRFMNESIDKLVSYIPSSSLMAMTKHYSEKDQFDLIRRKGVYPYEWMDDETKLNVRQLPPQKDFYSSLRGAGVSDADYQHAQNVWQAFKCQPLTLLTT